MTDEVLTRWLRNLWPMDYETQRGAVMNRWNWPLIAGLIFCLLFWWFYWCWIWGISLARYIDL